MRKLERIPMLAWLVAVAVLMVTGCTANLDAAAEPTVDAVQLPEEAQAYIDQSRADLARRLGAPPEIVELESITDPGESDGPYVVKLLVEGELYEYHGRDGEVLLVSEPLPTAPGAFTFAPAIVGEVEVRVDQGTPAPVSVVIRGNLPDNCTVIDEGLVSRSGEESFVISLTTRRPAGQPCGEVLVPYETTVSLGVEAAGLPAGEYSVTVNEQVSRSFTVEAGSAGEESGSPSVTVDVAEEVAAAVEATQVPAVEADENTPYFALYPAHAELDFEGYAHGNSMHIPRVYVYPAEPFASLNQAAAEPIQLLRDLLETRPDLAGVDDLPLLPLLNAGQMFHSQAEYVDFAGGSGIRYVTQYAQGAGPINNQELFYTFQGLTDDGAAYVAAIFPVAQDALPADVASAGDAFAADFEAYVAGVAVELEGAQAASFTPRLDALDRMVSTIEIAAQ